MVLIGRRVLSSIQRGIVVKMNLSDDLTHGGWPDLGRNAADRSTADELAAFTAEMRTAGAYDDAAGGRGVKRAAAVMAESERPSTPEYVPSLSTLRLSPGSHHSPHQTLAPTTAVRVSTLSTVLRLIYFKSILDCTV